MVQVLPRILSSIFLLDMPKRHNDCYTCRTVFSLSLALKFMFVAVITSALNPEKDCLCLHF